MGALCLPLHLCQVCEKLVTALLLLLGSNMVHCAAWGARLGALSPSVLGRVNVSCGRRVVPAVWASGTAYSRECSVLMKALRCLDPQYML